MGFTFRRAVASVTLATVVLQPSLTLAQVVPDPLASQTQRPSVDSAQNGVPLVQIAPPSTAGVSRNQFTQYSVDPRGVVLNNATAITQTQQAGWIDANPHLGGRAARVILNEVTSTSPSLLRGYTEVGGQRAEVVIANPNGITCSGCGFINASRGVLSTGLPVIAADGGLAALSVTRGAITLEGAGLNAANVDQIDLIARAVLLNASLEADKLNVIAGPNRVDYETLGTTRIGGDGAPPGVSIDVAALGGMYANRIRLVGTEAGVGVNSRGVIHAGTGGLYVTTEGRVVLSGNASSSAGATVAAQQGIANSGTFYASGDATLASGAALDNTGTLAAAGRLALSGVTVSQDGTAAGGVCGDGVLGVSGDLLISAQQNASATGRNLAGGSIAIEGASVDVSGSVTSAGLAATLASRSGNIDARNAIVEAGTALTATAAGTLDNSGGVIAATTVGITAQRIENRDGTLFAQTEVTVSAAYLDNTDGQIGSGGALGITADAIANGGGLAVSDGDLRLATHTLVGAGRVVAGRDLTLDVSGDFEHATGAILQADRDLRLGIAGDLANQGSIAAVGAMEITGRSVANESPGTISGGAIALTARDTFANRGRVDGDAADLRAPQIANSATIVGHQITASANAFSNTGAAALVGATDRLELSVRDSVSNTGGATLYSLGDLVIAGSASRATSGDYTARTGLVQNVSSLIEAQRDLVIAADRLDNLRDNVQTTTETVSSSTTSYQIWDNSWNPGVVNNPAYNPLIINPSDQLPDERNRVVDAVVREDRVVTSQPPGRILAGNHLTVRADTLNNFASDMVAGSLLDVDTSVLANSGVRLYRTDESVTTHNICSDIRGAGPGNFGSCQSGWVQVPTLASAQTVIGSIDANLRSDANVSLSATAIANNAVNPAGLPATTVVGALPGGRTLAPALGSGIVGNPIDTNFTLPAGGLFRVRLEPGHPYLVETDPRFADFARFISSDYMLGRLNLDPAGVGKRLGDGFYESQLVRDEIYRLTGRRFLAGYSSEASQFTALMDNAIPYAERLRLTFGVALSAEQMAALTHDIVWMVEQEVRGQKVLVPVVYLARTRPGDVAPDGALIAGEDIEIHAIDDLSNSGSIRGRRSLLASGLDIRNVGGLMDSGVSTGIEAVRDLLNLSGAIAGDDVHVAAGRDLLNETATGVVDLGRSSATMLAQRGVLSGRTNVDAYAGRDLIVRGGEIRSGGSAVLSAGRDVRVDTVVSRETRDGGTEESYFRSQRDTHLAGALAAENAISVTALRDVSLSGAQIRAGESATIAAGGDVSIVGVTDRYATDLRGESRDLRHTRRSLDESIIGSSLQAGGDVRIGAGLPLIEDRILSTGNVLVEGSSVSSRGGGVIVTAPGDITVRAATEQHDLDEFMHRQSRGVLSSRTTEQRDREAAALVRSSTLSADSVVLNAGGSIGVEGSNVVGTGDVRLTGGGSVSITSAAQSLETEHYRYQRQSGLMGASGGGGIGFTIGSQERSSNESTATLVNAPSTVGSLAGMTSIVAGGDYLQRGSEVVGGTGVDIVGRNVTIEAAEDRGTYSYRQEYKRSGVTIALGSPALNAAVLAADALDRADHVQDDRLKALYAYRAARIAAQGVSETVAQVQSGQAFFGVSVSYGSQQSQVEQKSEWTQARPSSVVSGGDVGVRAIEGDLNVIGSSISGANVALSAAHDLTLRAAQNSANTRTQQSSSASNVGVGVGFGTATGGVGVTVFASGQLATGNVDQSSLTFTETLVSAGDTLRLQSGRDTTLAGALSYGDRIEASAGGNLRIESQQDLETYRGTSRASGFGASVGISVTGALSNVSASGFGHRGDTASDYASVNETSGLFAGARGFDISVGGNTTLVAGQIGSAAPATSNHLSTGTLSYADLENRASFESRASGASLGFSYGAGGTPIVGGAPSIAPKQTGERSSVTVAAVAPGTIEIRDEINQQQAVSNLSRTPQVAAAPLERIFDARRVAENQELAAVFGQEAFYLVGSYAQSRTRPYQQAKATEQAAREYAELRAKGASALSPVERERLAYLEARGLSSENVGEVISRAQAEQAATRADYEAWGEGSVNKIALHAAVGALMASLGGGNAVSGALGSGATQAVLPTMQTLIAEFPGSNELSQAQRDQLLPVLSAIVGGAAAAALGGDAATGAGTAASATVNNYLKHTEVAEKHRRLAQCTDSACRDQIEREYGDKSVSNNNAVESACIDGGAAACRAARDELYTDAANLAALYDEIKAQRDVAPTSAIRRALDAELRDIQAQARSLNNQISTNLVILRELGWATPDEIAASVERDRRESGDLVAGAIQGGAGPGTRVAAAAGLGGASGVGKLLRILNDASASAKPVDSSPAPTSPSPLDAYAMVPKVRAFVPTAQGPSANVHQLGVNAPESILALGHGPIRPEAAEEIAVVQRWMSRAELDATLETGLLRGGRNGLHYVTNAANSDPLRARQRLALPQTPELRVTMEIPSSALSAPSTVLPAFNMPGGGTERTATGAVPVRVINVE